MSRIVVLVSGRGSNLQALIDAKKLGKIQSEIVLVVSNKDSAFALKRAQDANIPTQVLISRGQNNIEYFQTLLNLVSQHNPTWIVLAGFMRILSAEFVKAFEGRIINIHPSLLPLFPGLHAHQQALDAGATETGCTVHFVDEGCDTGPIILQKRIAILPNDTEDSLSERLLPIEHQALVEAMQILEGSSN